MRARSIGISIFLILSLGCLANAASVMYRSPNTAVYLGQPFSSLEFENPVGGLRVLMGHKIAEWRDADFAFPAWYDDWNVSHPGLIDGNVNEIWLRSAGQSANTNTNLAGTIISIHLTGDSNDGLADVLVDGVVVTTLDMGSMVPQTALVIVKNLSNSPHQIQVNAMGPGMIGPGADDVHILGAAVLRDSIAKWDQPPSPGHTGNIFYGWNEVSIYEQQQIAADDWVCSTDEPVTDVHWWGSFLNWKSGTPPEQQPARFHITIWTDVPAGMDKPFSHPGVVLWEYDCNTFTMEHVGWDWDPRTQQFEACFKYSCDLPYEKWFYQEPPPGGQNIYWLSIAAVYEGGVIHEYPWGWKTRPRAPASPAPDDAVRIFAPTAPHIGMVWGYGEPIWWPVPEESWDLAFELTTKKGIKWEQLPNTDYTGLHCHDSASPYQRITLADDWKCHGGLVPDLHWYGNYELMLPGVEWRGSGINYFHLSIHTDIPGPPYSQPGPEVWGKNIPFSMLTEINTGLFSSDGSPIYLYEYYLDEPFPQIEGQIYWFDISAISNDPQNPPHWRWQESGRNAIPALDAAVQRINTGSWNPIMWPGQPPNYSELAFAITSGPQETLIKWSQPPVIHTSPDLFNGWNEPSMYERQQIVADDWVCTSSMPMKDLHWWGSFLGWGEVAPPLLPDAFHIAIWTDVPAGVDGPFSHPGVVIWQTIANNYTCQFAGWDIDPRNPLAAPETCYKYEQDFTQDQWFYQDPGQNIYWVSISAIYQTPVNYVWGWKTRPRNPDSPAPDDAVAIYDPTAPAPGMIYGSGSPLWWPTPRDSWDTSFTITTGCFDPIMDTNGDLHVDSTDFDYFSACYNGPTNPVTGICLCVDSNDDNYVDATDFDSFSACYNGPTNPPGC